MRLLRIQILAAFLLLLVPASAWAKSVSLKWKPIKGAVEYEVSIEQKGQPVLKEKVDDNSWSGDLNFGVYAYQIRGYDRVQRPGAWSAFRPLVVMPKGPEAVSPHDGETITSYSPKTRAGFKWSAVVGVENYRLWIRDGSKVVYDQVVHGTEAEVHGLAPGKYSWEIAVQYQAGDRAPSSFKGKKWSGHSGFISEFTLDHEDLKAPEIVSPEGLFRPTEQGQVEFEWKPVVGAEAYEVSVEPKRLHADDPSRAVHWTARSTTSTAKIPRDGSYVWRVRALASIDGNVADAVGAQSSTEFRIDHGASFQKHSGYLAVSTMVAPYYYSASSPGQNSNTQGDMKSTSSSLRVSGEYWLQPQTGISVMAQDSFFTINGENFDHKDVEADLKYRTYLSGGERPWTLMPKIGILSREYVLLTAPFGSTVGTMDSNTFTTFGPTAGFDLRKQLLDNFSLGVQAQYYFPVASTEGSIQRGSASNRNMSLGVQGLYWFDPTWSVGMGVYFENRSIANLNPNRTQADTINMDGTYFFGSLIYSFGNP